MKKVLIICFAIAALARISTAPAAVAVSVAVGDQPYYVHGPDYWAGSVHYFWVPGHWGHRHGRAVWIHGHYRVR